MHGIIALGATNFQIHFFRKIKATCRTIMIERHQKIQVVPMHGATSQQLLDN